MLIRKLPIDRNAYCIMQLGNRHFTSQETNYAIGNAMAKSALVPRSLRSACSCRQSRIYLRSALRVDVAVRGPPAAQCFRDARYSRRAHPFRVRAYRVTRCSFREVRDRGAIAPPLRAAAADKDKLTCNPRHTVSCLTPSIGAMAGGTDVRIDLLSHLQLFSGACDRRGIQPQRRQYAASAAKSA